MSFEVPISVDGKKKQQQVTTLHLICAFSFLATGTIIMIYNYTIPQWGFFLFLVGLEVLILTLFWNKTICKPRINFLYRIAELTTATILCGYSFYQHWKFPSGIFAMISAALFFGIYNERNAGKTESVIIDENGITIPFSIKTTLIQWKDILHVVLKYDTLSVNCLDDSFFQWSVGKIAFDANEFDKYCTKKIIENETKGVVDDW